VDISHGFTVDINKQILAVILLGRHQSKNVIAAGQLKYTIYRDSSLLRVLLVLRLHRLFTSILIWVH